MSAIVAVEHIFSAQCPECEWADGDITTTMDEAERMVDGHNADRHPERIGGGSALTDVAEHVEQDTAVPVLADNYRSGSRITIRHEKHGTISGQMLHVEADDIWIIPLQTGHVDIGPGMFNKGWWVVSITHLEHAVGVS